jgi:hypothetical protein
MAGHERAAVFRSLNEKVGQKLRLRIRRDGDERDLKIKLGSREEVTYRIGGSPTSEQLKIRESWLKRWPPRGRKRY